MEIENCHKHPYQSYYLIIYCVCIYYLIVKYGRCQQKGEEPDGNIEQDNIPH